MAERSQKVEQSYKLMKEKEAKITVNHKEIHLDSDADKLVPGVDGCKNTFEKVYFGAHCEDTGFSQNCEFFDEKAGCLKGTECSRQPDNRKYIAAVRLYQEAIAEDKKVQGR